MDDETRARKQKKLLAGLENVKNLMWEANLAKETKVPENPVAPVVTSDGQLPQDAVKEDRPMTAKERSMANLKTLMAEATAKKASDKAIAKKAKPAKVQKTNKKNKGQGKPKKDKDWDDGFD